MTVEHCKRKYWCSCRNEQKFDNIRASAGLGPIFSGPARTVDFFLRPGQAFSNSLSELSDTDLRQCRPQL